MEKVFPLFIQKYETFTTDNSASLTNKINSIVQALNQLGKISNDVVHDWNKVMEWAMGEGLDESTNKGIDNLVNSGRFDELIQLALTDFNEQVEEVQTKLNGLSEFRVNILYPPFGISSPAKDGTTDITSILQSCIDYVLSKGGGEVFLPPIPNGYRISGMVDLKTGVNLLGYNTKLTIPSSSTITDVFQIKNQTGKIQIQGFNVTVPVSQVNFIHVHEFGGDLVVKDMYVDGFLYFLKIDPNSNPAVNRLLVENITGVNLTMPFLMSNVNKFIGKNIDTTTLNVSRYHHHYYLQKNVKDVSLQTIRATGGMGSVFSYNDTLANTSEEPDTFYVDDLKCFSIARLISLAINIHKVKMSNVNVDNFVKTVDDLDPIYIGGTATDLTLDGFYLGPSKWLYASENTAYTSIKLTFKNGSFGRFRNELAVSNINELNLINVVYDNAIYGTSTSGASSSTSMFLRIPSSNPKPVTVNARDVVLNLKTSDVGATITSGTEVIRLLGAGEFTFENLRVFTDNPTNTDTLGRFLTCISSLPNTTFKLINCDIRTLSSYEFNTGTIGYYYKINSYYKRNLIS